MFLLSFRFHNAKLGETFAEISIRVPETLLVAIAEHQAPDDWPCQASKKNTTSTSQVPQVSFLGQNCLAKTCKNRKKTHEEPHTSSCSSRVRCAGQVLLPGWCTFGMVRTLVAKKKVCTEQQHMKHITLMLVHRILHLHASHAAVLLCLNSRSRLLQLWQLKPPVPSGCMASSSRPIGWAVARSALPRRAWSRELGAAGPLCWARRPQGPRDFPRARS